MKFDEEKLRNALSESWSLKSARQWTEECPVAGQCNVTAAVVRDLFGGEILKTPWSVQTPHFCNCIDGQVYDFTDLQFETPITYLNEPSTIEEASAGYTGSEYESLRQALVNKLNEKQ